MRRSSVATNERYPESALSGHSSCHLIRGAATVLLASVANTFWQRLRGLHALPPLSRREALLIRPCNSVHTFRLAYGIDVAYLDRQGVILKLVSLVPGQVSLCWSAKAVVEMPQGCIKDLALAVGQTLCMDGKPWT